MFRQYCAQRFRSMYSPIAEIVRRKTVYYADPREYVKWDGASHTFRTVRIRGGHLAVVQSLRNRRRRKTVADWVLLACLDAGLESSETQSSPLPFLAVS